MHKWIKENDEKNSLGRFILCKSFVTVFSAQFSIEYLRLNQQPLLNQPIVHCSNRHPSCLVAMISRLERQNFEMFNLCKIDSWVEIARKNTSVRIECTNQCESLKGFGICVLTFGILTLPAVWHEPHTANLKMTMHSMTTELQNKIAQRISFGQRKAAIDTASKHSTQTVRITPCRRCVSHTSKWWQCKTHFVLSFLLFQILFSDDNASEILLV